ncbi:MAG: hypothetical protein ACR2FN_07320 [Chitinophagaceae bacterium]
MLNENNQSAPHVLNTSSNLLGLCFIVLTSLKVLKLSGYTLIDEFTAVTTIFFITSSILSFLSIRTSKRVGIIYIKIAEVTFLAGLSLLFIIMMLITFNFIK